MGALGALRSVLSEKGDARGSGLKAEKEMYLMRTAKDATAVPNERRAPLDTKGQQFVLDVGKGLPHATG